MERELTTAHYHTVPFWKEWFEFIFWVFWCCLFCFFSSLVDTLPVKVKPYHTPTYLPPICCFTHFFRPNERNKNMLVLENEYSRVLLIGNNVAGLITVKCWMSAAKWCFQMFSEPVSIESGYSGRRLFCYLLPSPWQTFANEIFVKDGRGIVGP